MNGRSGPKRRGSLA